MIDPSKIPGVSARARIVSSLFAAALLVVTMLVAAWHWTGCAAGPVRRQAQVASAVASAFNRVARPALIDAYEASCREAIVNACPSPPCARGDMLAALAFCDARWQPAIAAYEAAAAAHGAWRQALLACQADADGGACDVDLTSALGRATEAVNGYRCAVRALGRPDLDPLPGLQVTCEVRDGG